MWFINSVISDVLIRLYTVGQNIFGQAMWCLVLLKFVHRNLSPFKNELVWNKSDCVFVSQPILSEFLLFIQVGVNGLSCFELVSHHNGRLLQKTACFVWPNRCIFYLNNTHCAMVFWWLNLSLNCSPFSFVSSLIHMASVNQELFAYIYGQVCVFSVNIFILSLKTFDG